MFHEYRRKNKLYCIIFVLRYHVNEQDLVERRNEEAKTQLIYVLSKIYNNFNFQSKT